MAQSSIIEHPTWQWRCGNGDSMLNFHPAFTVDSARILVFDSIPYAKNYTMVVVYKPVVETEAMVWWLDYDTSAMRGLTTEHIFSDSVTIRYTDTTTGIPVINTLRQTAPDSMSHVRLTLGGGGLVGSVKVAEIIYFNRRLDNATLRRVQSALAVRYGITLGPVDYLDADGDVIWHYADNGQYHHRVTGIGSDSTLRLHQLQSRSEMAGSLLTLQADSLSEGVFLICGDNDAPLNFGMEGDAEVLSRRWKINCNSIENLHPHLTFDTRGLAGFTDSLVLIVDGYVYLPDMSSPGNVSFRHITIPSDSSTFTLARGMVFWQEELCGNGPKGVNSSEDGAETVKTSVYPNPSWGDFTIEVSGALWVNVSIYNAQGMLMDSFADRERTYYYFDGTLPKGNSYYATVTTDKGSQTLKLIVK